MLRERSMFGNKLGDPARHGGVVAWVRTTTLLVALSVAMGLGATGVTAQRALPAMAQADGSEIRSVADRVAVGLQNGGIVVYDGPSRKPVFGWTESLGAPVSDVLLARDEVWWLVEGRDELRVMRKGWPRPAIIDLSKAGLTRPALRLSGWRGGVFVHGDTDVILVDGTTRRAKPLEKVLPTNVAMLARQGMLLTNWDGVRGILLVARRYGKLREGRNPREIADLTMFTAWSVDRKGTWRKHGAYVSNLVRQQAAAGPRVRIDLNGRQIEQDYGWGPVHNIAVTDEGFVALGYDHLKIVPFTDGNWLPDTLETGAIPQYAESLSTSAGNAWWSDGRQLFCAGIEDGSTDVYVPNDTGEPVRGVAAEGDGAWVLLDHGVRRLVPWREERNGYAGFTRFSLGDGDAVDTEDQARLAEIADSVSALDAKGLDSYSFMRRIYGAAGIQIPTRTEAMAETRPGKRIYGEVRYGDLLVGPSTASVYIGNGVTLRAQNGTVVRGQMRLEANTRIVRYQETVAADVAFARVPPNTSATDFTAPYIPDAWTARNPLLSYTQPQRRAWRAPEVGVGRPKLSLGHSQYVRINPGGPNDRPTRPEHFQLLDVAKGYFGLPYQWGGNGPGANQSGGIDCSGFVHQVFRRLGISIPRQSQLIGQAAVGEVVTDELRFGDVLVFRSPGHVAIYVGNGRTVETTRASPRGGPGYSSVYRRSQAVVRRFLPS